METKFNSQICTTREQSERLLALGLKKETADMYYQKLNDKWSPFIGQPLSYDGLCGTYLIPAWSLHRLIEMMPKKVFTPTKGHYYWVLYNSAICYEIGDYSIVRFYGENCYDNIIDCIEWLIKEGYFNKEYLAEETIEEHCKGVLEYLDYIREED